MKRTILAVLLLATSCSVTPTYHVPVVAIPPSYKEAADWVPSNPADARLRGDWWAMFGDPELDRLEGAVAARNQTVAGAIAAYDQALAIVRASRSAQLPSVNGSAGVTQSGSVDGSTPAASHLTAALGATWEPDLFGTLRAGVGQSRASADAEHATLGNVILAAQAQLANSYIELRGLDAQIDAYDATIQAYERTLRITQNRYNAGVAARVDVLQAQAALNNAQAGSTDLVRQRKQFEHAVAVLVGEVPASLSLRRTVWAPVVPAPPLSLPSTLLERRPDIAAAERNVAAANFGIGIQRGAFFPAFSLSAGLNQNATSIGNLVSLGASVWSLGLTGAMTLLDFGGRRAKVAQARAVYEQAAASYRQTVLTAFQQVEDGLGGTVLLEREEAQLKSAADAANRVEQLTLNQYMGGVADYTAVVTAQTTALTTRRAVIGATVNRQLNAIALSQALGGGWSGLK